MKEYAVQEMFEEKEGTKFKDTEGDIYIIKNRTVFKLYGDYEERELLLNKRWFETRFTKIQEPVSFMKAISNEKNMIKVDIEDIICGLSENMKEQLREYNTIGATLYCLSNYFTNESLVKIFQEGKWYIEK